MGKRLGRFAGKAAVVAVCSAALFALPIWLKGATLVQSAEMLATVYAFIAVWWVGGLLVRKLFPNAVRRFQEDQRNTTFAGDGDT